jgi:hypothetical protein
VFAWQEIEALVLDQADDDVAFWRRMGEGAAEMIEGYRALIVSATTRISE